MKISADVLRGYTDVILLRQLETGDSYGYQINKQVSRISGGNLELKEIRSYWGNEDTGARRRYYTLTDAGRLRLKEEAVAWAETRKMLDRLIGETEGLE